MSRVAYSDADKAARAKVMEWMRAAKLEPSIDFAGNIIGRRAGSDASLHPLLFGSHIDSVPGGGNYDGQVGSTSAIEVAQTLAEHSIVTRHPLEVVIWQNEEGGLFGSRAVSGQLTTRRAEDCLEQRQDRRGRNSLSSAAIRRKPRRGQASEGRDRRLLRAAHRAGRHARRGEDRHRRRRGNRRDQAVGGHGHRISEPRRHDGDGPAARRAAIGRALRRHGESRGARHSGPPGRNRRTDSGVSRARRTSYPARSSARSSCATSTTRRSIRCTRRSARKPTRSASRTERQFAFSELHVERRRADRSAHAQDHHRRGGVARALDST